MAESVEEDPRTWDEGYSEAVGGMRDRLVGSASAAPPQSMPTQSATPATDMLGLARQMFMQQMAEVEKPKKEIPKWVYFLPGSPAGIAKLRQQEHQDEQLKLQKQQMVGQQAMQRLQQLAMIQKIEQQQHLKRWGGLYGGLMKHEGVLDDEATREIEGQMAREIAESGDVDAVTKFEESRREARATRAMDAAQKQMQSFQPGAPPADAAPAPSPAPPGAPGPTPVASPGAAAPAATAATTAGKPVTQNMYARLIREEAVRQGVDPDLALAVAQQESGMNPQAIGDNGKSIGLFQLQPAAAADVGMEEYERRDALKNIKGGVAFLKQKLGQSGGDVDKALLRYNGGGDPNYVRNVRSHLPAKTGMSQMVAGPGAPAPAAGAQPQAQNPGAGVGEAMARDKIELARLRQQEAQVSGILTQNQQYGGTKTGKARLDAWKDQREELQQQIKRVEDRVLRGEKRGEDLTDYEKKRQDEMTDYEKKQRIAVGLEAPGVRENRELQRRKLEADLAKETPEGLEKQRQHELEKSRQQGVVAAEKAGEVAKANKEAELQYAPLGEAMAERVSNLNTIITFVNDIGTLRQNNFTGRIAGYEGAIREFTGNITKDEVQFRQLLKDATDLLSRARSGAAINEAEQKRLEKILPQVGEPSNVFVAKLEQFGRSVETLRDEKVKLATTPRGKLLETMPRVQGAGTPSAAPVDTSKKAVGTMTLEEARQEERRLKGGK